MVEKLNMVAAAKILGVDLAQMREWISAGMPYESNPGGFHKDRFVIADIVKWHIDNANKGFIEESTMTAVEAKRRREVALALSAELDLAVKRGQLVVIDDLMVEFGAALIDVRAAITSQSNRLTGLLAHQDEDTVSALLNDDAQDMLEKLSSYVHQCRPVSDDSGEAE